LFAAADASWRASGATRYPPDDLSYARDVQAVKGQLGHHMFEEAVAEGHSMTAAQAMSYALGEG
jgi:pimeloyl-ACP methyl ester carboxylesterase